MPLAVFLSFLPSSPPRRTSHTCALTAVPCVSEVLFSFWNSVFSFSPHDLYRPALKFAGSSASSALLSCTEIVSFDLSFWTLQFQNFHLVFSHFCLSIGILYLIRHCQCTSFNSVLQNIHLFVAAQVLRCCVRASHCGGLSSCEAQTQ